MRRALIAAAIVLVLATAALITWVVRATPMVRDRVVAALNDRFASKVDLQSLDVSIFPNPGIDGSGLVLRHNGRTDVPPLVAIERFDASATVRGLYGRPLHLRTVRLEGLDIHIPVGGLRTKDVDDNPEPRRPNDEPPPVRTAATPGPSPIIIDTIESRRASLVIATSRPGRLPRTFDIEDLVMTGFGLPEGARYHAGLVNPVPKGRIETSGTFGPWNADEPDMTPIRGEYAFNKADLDVIKGIGGILTSVGTYTGVLQRLVVEGQTETPDFSLDIAGQPVPLATQFTAIVDGTNGDTWLERVEAKLGQSTILARGAIVRTQDVKGRRVALDVQLEDARLEDLMRLSVKAEKTPMTGRVDVDTKFLLPAGQGDVIERLQLDGRFALARAKFTNIDVQQKINLLSSRGRGDEDADGTGESVVSNLSGQFRMRNARLDFSNLRFAVPGAVVQLTGSYDLKGEAVDFEGYFLADASLADMTSGVKSLVARLAQPFFRRPGGGTRVPIRIAGPRASPKFGLDAGRIFKKS